MDNILKIMNFKINLHFALFSSHSYQRYLFYIWHTTHTIQIHTDKWTHTDTHGHRCSTTFTFFTFCDMPQIYTCTDTQTHADTSSETPAHTDTDTCTQTYISTHADIHRHTCIFFTYTNTHTYMSG